MEDLKLIIAKNIVQLRKEKGITQAQLAESLNYSDKAVSKWERGESLPDVGVLKMLANMFGVTVDYLLKTDHKKEQEYKSLVDRREKRNRKIITAISIVLVWLVASVVFFILDAATGLSPESLGMCYVYSVPVTTVVWLIFNSIWFNKRWNFLITSLLMWSSLAALFITFTKLGLWLWLIFIVGVPAQIIIFLWSGIKTRKVKKLP